MSKGKPEHLWGRGEETFKKQKTEASVRRGAGETRVMVFVAGSSFIIASILPVR